MITIERAVYRLMKAGRKAIDAQERYDYWTQFGTNSSRARNAETNRTKALADLDRAEADIVTLFQTAKEQA